MLDCAAEVSARQQGGVYKARLCRRRVTVNGGARKHTYLPRSSGALKKIWSMPPRVTARHAVTVARGTQLRPCARCFGRLAALIASLRIGEGAGEARGITVHPEDVLAVSGPACTCRCSPRRSRADRFLLACAFRHVVVASCKPSRPLCSATLCGAPFVTCSERPGGASMRARLRVSFALQTRTPPRTCDTARLLQACCCLSARAANAAGAWLRWQP